MSSPDIEAIWRSEIRAWIARGGRSEWTPETIWALIDGYMTHATPDQAAQLAARLIGFAEGMTRMKEEQDGRNRNGS